MKRLTALLLALLLLTGCAAQPPETTPAATTTAPETDPDPTWQTVADRHKVTAQQYFVYNCETEQFLTISGSPADKIYPASVTKLFTAYVAIQFLSADMQITAGDALDLVAAGSSVAEIKKGDILTVKQLVQAMLLPSGNDAACILAVAAGRLMKGKSLSAANAAKAFVEEMNAQAALLGLKDTHFANPDGIHSDSHYTTFADAAKLGLLALEDPTILEFAKVSSQTVTFVNGTAKTWINTNALIDVNSPYYCPYALGLKTGQTPYAGSCLLSAFEVKGTTLIIGVFGCPKEEDRFVDTLWLLQKTIG